MNFLFVFFIVGVVAYLFSATIRGLLNAAVLNTGAWIASHLPTVGGILAVIAILFALPIILGISWIGLWAAIGSMALAPVAGLTVGILSLIGIFAFRKTIGIILTIAFIAIVIGFCFPILKGAWNRYSVATQIEHANGLDNATLQKQPMGVVSGVMIEDAIMYDNDGKITTTNASKGIEVRTVSLEKRQFAGNPETFVNIMLPNITGDYIDGSCGWIPVRKLKLGATAAEEAKQAEKNGAEQRAKSLADEVSRRELEKETAAGGKLVKMLEIPEGSRYTKTLRLEGGEYCAAPADAKVYKEGGMTENPSGFSVKTPSELVGFSPPKGGTKVSIYRKEGG